jgi:hypothetical protein
LNTEEILAQIDEEISKLQQAKALLLGNAVVKRSVGRPKKSAIASRILSVQPAKGVLSAEGKARIAAAQRKRWAKSRKAAVKTVAKAAKPVKKAAAKKAVKAIPVKASTPTG